jgi:hypothetical protein
MLASERRTFELRDQTGTAMVTMTFGELLHWLTTPGRSVDTVPLSEREAELVESVIDKRDTQSGVRRSV